MARVSVARSCSLACRSLVLTVAVPFSSGDSTSAASAAAASAAGDGSDPSPKKAKAAAPDDPKETVKNYMLQVREATNMRASGETNQDGRRTTRDRQLTRWLLFACRACADTLFPSDASFLHRRPFSPHSKIVHTPLWSCTRICISRSRSPLSSRSWTSSARRACCS